MPGAVIGVGQEAAVVDVECLPPRVVVARKTRWRLGVVVGRTHHAGAKCRVLERHALGGTGGTRRWRSHHTLYRSEEHTSELQSLMRISYAVFCLKKKNNIQYINKRTIRYNRTPI